MKKPIYNLNKILYNIHEKYGTHSHGLFGICECGKLGTFNILPKSLSEKEKQELIEFNKRMKKQRRK